MTNPTRSQFDCTPKPAFLLGMRNQDWTAAGALSELVDNSFGPGRGNANLVQITYDITHRTLVVRDDGQGMEAVGRLFQLGNTIGRMGGDIGIYGCGGTYALLWLADKVEVVTMRDELVSSDTVDWQRCIKDNVFPVVSNRWLKATAHNTPANLLETRHGTSITLHLSREKSFSPSTVPGVMRSLSQTYAPAIRLGKELHWHSIKSGELVEKRRLIEPISLPEDPDRKIAFDAVVETGDQALNVHGEIGAVEDLPVERSRIAIGFGPRVIALTRECFGLSDGSEKFLGAGVTGWLQLGEGWQPLLTTTKNAINDRPAWDALMDAVFRRIRPLLVQVQQAQQTIIFQDIALQLEAALNSDSRAHFHIDTALEEERRLEQREERELSEAQGLGAGPEEEEPPEPGENGPKDKIPAITRLEIRPLSDAEMEGALCRVDLIREAVTASVNRDHVVIKAAMEARPINRMALNLLVTHELADALRSKPALLKKLFPLRIVRQLGDKSETEVRRIVTRLLMDRVRDRNAA